MLIIRNSSVHDQNQRQVMRLTQSGVRCYRIWEIALPTVPHGSLGSKHHTPAECGGALRSFSTKRSEPDAQSSVPVTLSQLISGGYNPPSAKGSKTEV